MPHRFFTTFVIGLIIAPHLSQAGPAIGQFEMKDDDGDGAEINIGIGWFFGLNKNTPDHTLKWSVEYEF